MHGSRDSRDSIIICIFLVPIAIWLLRLILIADIHLWLLGVLGGLLQNVCRWVPAICYGSVREL